MERDAKLPTSQSVNANGPLLPTEQFGGRPAPSWLYSGWALAGLAVAVAGFSPTFFLPSARGEFHAPLVVHLHGLLAFGWLLMVVAQTQFVRMRRVAWHRRLGILGATCAAGFVVTGVAVGLWATRRDLAAGLGDFARGQFVNILIELAVFGGLVLAGLLKRRDREWHKRLLLLATISALGPAWFRLRHLFPWVPYPLVTFSLLADAVLLAVIGQELATRRRVHVAFVTVAPLMVAVHLAELFLSHTTPWLTLARRLLGEAGP